MQMRRLAKNLDTLKEAQNRSKKFNKGIGKQLGIKVGTYYWYLIEKVAVPVPNQ